MELGIRNDMLWYCLQGEKLADGGGGGGSGGTKRKKTESEMTCCGIVCRGEFLAQFVSFSISNTTRVTGGN